MRLEPIGNPIEEKAGEVAGLLSGWTADAVGGRNLLLGSSAEPTEMDLPERLHYRDIGEDTLLEVGQEYTFSVIVDKLSDDDHPINVEVGTGTGRNYTRDITSRSDVTFGERTVITFTPTEHHLDGRTHFAWRIRNRQNETRIAYREAKLERGPRATPWTPAPEDSVQSLLEGNPLSSIPSPFPAHDPALAFGQLYGEGFPEGKVSAPVGSIYTDRLATNGAIRWIKTQGTENTGWKVEWGDTGWRDITDLVRIPLTQGWIRVRRTHDGVWVRVSNLRSDVIESNRHLITIPTGFLPGNPDSTNFLVTGPSLWHIWVSGRVWAWGTKNNATAVSRGEVFFDSREDWPSTLPGTPA